MADRAEFRFVLVDQGAGPGQSGPPVGGDGADLAQRGRGSGQLATGVVAAQIAGSRESQGQRSKAAESKASRMGRGTMLPELAVAGHLAQSVVGAAAGLPSGETARDPAPIDIPDAPVVSAADKPAGDGISRTDHVDVGKRDREKKAADELAAKQGADRKERNDRTDKAAAGASSKMPTPPPIEPPLPGDPIFKPDSPPADAKKPPKPLKEPPLPPEPAKPPTPEEIRLAATKRIKDAGSKAGAAIGAAKGGLGGLAGAGLSSGIAAFTVIGGVVLAAAAAFKIVTSTVQAFDAAMLSTAKELSNTNAALAKAAALRQRDLVLASIERGQVLGPSLSQYVGQRTRQEIAIQKLTDAFTSSALEEVVPLMKIMTVLLEAIAEHSEGIGDFIVGSLKALLPVWVQRGIDLLQVVTAIADFLGLTGDEKENFITKFDDIDPLQVKREGGGLPAPGGFRPGSQFSDIGIRPIPGIKVP